MQYNFYQTHVATPLLWWFPILIGLMGAVSLDRSVILKLSVKEAQDSLLFHLISTWSV